jgi:hypothetical protein
MLSNRGGRSVALARTFNWTKMTMTSCVAAALLAACAVEPQEATDEGAHAVTAQPLTASSAAQPLRAVEPSTLDAQLPTRMAQTGGRSGARPLDVGTPQPGCQFRQNKGGPSVANGFAIGTDYVAEYECPGNTCQPGGGANENDYASKGSIAGAVANPVIQPIFWGTGWQTASPSVAQVTAALKTLIQDTPYFDGLKQYGMQSITLGDPTIAEDNPPSSYQDGDVSGRVFKIIDSTSIFSNRNGSWIFMVFMPPGSSPPSDLCGYHAIDAEFNWFQINTANIGWAAFSDLDSIMASATHEIVEAITNPYGSTQNLNAWTMDRNFSGGSDEDEIADGCLNQDDYLGGILVTSYFSEAAHACVIPFAPPTVTGMTPLYGPAGTVVTVTGTNLNSGVTSVNFGSTPATNVACSSSTHCTATVPPGSGFAKVTVTAGYQTVCLPPLPNSAPGTTCGIYGYPCVPKTVAQACAGVPCGTVPDGCSGTITCPVNCPSGETCSATSNYTCCTPPVPGTTVPNQCPAICPVCPLGETCEVGLGEAYGFCVPVKQCPKLTHPCSSGCCPG